MSGARRRWRLLLFLLPALTVPQSSASAHVLDEYVQATLVDVDPAAIRLQINLTPGVEVADQVLALIDADRDGAISRQESDAYAELVKRDLAARLDGRDVELRVTAASIPAPPDLRSGEGIVQMEFTLAPAELAAGAHKLAFKNRHLPAIGVYLFNAAAPRTNAIEILRQTRSNNQSAGEIEFAHHAPARSLLPATAVLLAVLAIAAIMATWQIARRSRRSI